MNKLSFNQYDAFVAIWLIIGLFRGRKHGMSEELLPVVQWLLIVVVGSQTYSYVSTALVKNIPGYGQLTANFTAYIGIAIMLKLIFSKIKTGMGEKLVGSDVFGRGEYYLGVLAGMVRFACMVIFFCAILNAYTVTAAERAKTAKEMHAWSENIDFPTYGSVQNGLLNESWTGRLIKDKLADFLIRSVGSSGKPAKETSAQQTQKDLDAVMDSGKRK